MKTTCCLLLVLLVLPRLWAAAPVSVEEFKKISSPEARQKIINEAPSEQKEELQRIDMRLQLVRQYGGEEALKSNIKAAVARARGLPGLTALFNMHASGWTYYFQNLIREGIKAGMPEEKIGEWEVQLAEKRADLEKRGPAYLELVYNAAPSPQALELEKRATRLITAFDKRCSSGDGSGPNPPFTKEELMEEDKQMDQIFEVMKQLPRLPPEQLQKEYDAYPEEKLYRKMTGTEVHPCFGICETTRWHSPAPFLIGVLTLVT